MNKTIIDLDNNQILRSQNIEYNNTTLKEHLDSIIESGTNDKGSWIKYSNGAMIQYGKITKNVNIKNKSTGSNWYYDDGYVINFPLAFSDTDYFPDVISASGNLITLKIYSITPLENSYCKFNLSSNIEYSNSTHYFRWFAIGRWK